MKQKTTGGPEESSSLSGPLALLHCCSDLLEYRWGDGEAAGFLLLEVLHPLDDLLDPGGHGHPRAPGQLLDTRDTPDIVRYCRRLQSSLC